MPDSTPIYLDYNATVPVRPEVLARMAEILARPLNPSSVHANGRAAKQILENARRVIAEAVSAFSNEVIFTASGTEANHMALRGFPKHRVLVSAIEHSSVLKAVPHAQKIPVDEQGRVKPEVLDAMLSKEPTLVSVMLANNETGVIQPMRELAQVTKKHGALLHTDAAQALGKIPVDFGALGADLMTLSAHKCGGPVGAAALVIRSNLAIQSLLTGGGQELGRRAGTENLAAIAGFAGAVECFDFAHMKSLRGWLDALEQDCLSVAKNAMIWGAGVERLPNTSLISMPGVNSETQLIHFDLEGFMLSAGSACSSGKIEPSHVLDAMGAGEMDAASAIRISGGWATREEEIKNFAKAWKKLCEKLGKAGNTSAFSHAAAQAG